LPEKGELRIVTLIAVPSLITLAITTVRLMAQLQDWPWFNPTAGVAGAVVGIGWLPLIFGPYFAWKLAAAGQGPASTGRAVGAALGGMVVAVLGGFVGFSNAAHPGFLSVTGFFIVLVSALIPGMGWRTLGQALLAYAVAARVPVVTAMFIALSAGSGQPWVLHHAPLFWQRFLDIAVFPQLTFWIGWTVVVGSLLGSIVVTAFRPGVQA